MPAVGEKCQIEFRDQSKLLARLHYSRSQNSKARNKTLNFLIECSCTSLKFSIETLVEEIKTVVSEMFELEYREKSLFLAIFDICDNQYSHTRIKRNEFSLEFASSSAYLWLRLCWKESNLFLRNNVCISWSIKTVVREKQFKNWDKSILMAILEISDYRVFDWSFLTFNFLSVYPGPVEGLRLRLVMAEINSVLEEKGAFENRDESFLCYFLECSDYQQFDARIKMMDLVTECPREFVEFSIDTSMIEMKPVVFVKN